MTNQSSAARADSVRDVPDPGLAVLALQAAEQDVLVVVGEADIATAQHLYDQVVQLLPTPPRAVLVELGALTFCDSAGVDALRDIARAAEVAGVVLVFRGQSEQLQWLQRTVPASYDQRSPALRAVR